jgi:hypothetical protein
VEIHCQVVLQVCLEMAFTSGVLSCFAATSFHVVITYVD